MWNRSQLKEKAKVSFKANYWKSVLVAMLLAMLVGTSGGAVSGVARNGSAGEAIDTVGDSSYSTVETSDDEATTIVDDPNLTVTEAPGQDGALTITVTDESGETHETIIPSADEKLVAAAPILLALVGIVLIVLVAVIVTIKVLLVNPLEVGGRRFFMRNLNQQAPVRELAYAYDHGYRNVVKALFLRDIKVLGWTLLLVVPGIIKHYEYLMVPFLLGEDAELTPDEAFAQSRALMSGNKWRAFVLDLSFIGWDLLVALTLGIAGVFYVNPYREQTRAALYEALRYGDGMPAFEALPEA